MEENFAKKLIDALALKVPTESVIIHGTVVKEGDNFYVKLDGSNEKTAVTSQITLAEGQRVSVNIYDHKAMVIGSPTDQSVTKSQMGGGGGGSELVLSGTTVPAEWPLIRFKATDMDAEVVLKPIAFTTDTTATIRLPDKSGTLAIGSDYLPLTGGTVTGGLNVSSSSSWQTSDGIHMSTNGYMALTRIGANAPWYGFTKDGGTGYARILYNSAAASAPNSNTDVYLPDTAGTLLTNNSNLNASKIIGTIAGEKVTSVKTIVSVRTPLGTSNTGNNRIEYLTSNASTLSVVGNHGTQNGSSTLTFASSSSDKRLKRNIELSKVDALEYLNRIVCRQFDWKDVTEGGHWDCGVIADEIEKLDPKLTIGGGYDEEGRMNIKTVNSFYLQGYMLKAIQELSQQVDELKEEIRKLKEEE